MIWFQIQYGNTLIEAYPSRSTNFWCLHSLLLGNSNPVFCLPSSWHKIFESLGFWTTDLWAVHPWLQQMLPSKGKWYIRGQKKTVKLDRQSFICESPWQVITRENDFCWPCLWPDCLNSFSFSLSSTSGLLICVIPLFLTQWKQQKNLHNSFNHIPKGIWKIDFPR